MEPFIELKEINDEKEAIIADLSVQVCSTECAVTYKENAEGYFDECKNEIRPRFCAFQACTAPCKQKFYGTTEIEPGWYVENNYYLVKNTKNYKTTAIGLQVYANLDGLVFFASDDYS